MMAKTEPHQFKHGELVIGNEKSSLSSYILVLKAAIWLYNIIDYKTSAVVFVLNWSLFSVF